VRQARALRPTQKLALITLSGHSSVSSGNDVWCGIASIMEEVGANILDAAGAFMRDAEFRSDIGVGGMGSSGPGFFAHPFGTLLTPFVKSSEGEDGAESFAVAILVKALIAERSVPKMTRLLSTNFPRLVCTTTYGGVAEAFQPSAEASEAVVQRPCSGTLRLFGSDRFGQLSKISAVLAECGVTILNLLVTTGFGDRDTHEFVERAGGPLSQNVISVAAFDRAAFDEDLLRREVTRAAREVGYEVTSIIFDTQADRARREELADYYLRRKSSIREYLAKRGDL